MIEGEQLHVGSAPRQRVVDKRQCAGITQGTVQQTVHACVQSAIFRGAIDKLLSFRVGRDTASRCAASVQKHVPRLLTPLSMAVPGRWGSRTYFTLLMLWDLCQAVLADNRLGDCDALATKFAVQRHSTSSQLTPSDPSKMLFFVHIPRTAGPSRLKTNEHNLVMLQQP